MDLLTYISQATKRKPKFVDRADEMVSDHPTLSDLEGEMELRNAALVARLKADKIRMSEFKRVAADETIVSALSAIIMGRQKRTQKLTDTAFAASMQSMPYLFNFFEDIDYSLRNGRISKNKAEAESLETLGYDSPSKYAKRALDATDDLSQEVIDGIPTRLLDPEGGAAKPATWEGVEERLSRYLVTPAYGWHAYGEQDYAQSIGQRQMVRSCRNDKRSCRECIMYDSMGWQPIGLLPLPGQRCRCRDRCRCEVFYR